MPYFEQKNISLYYEIHGEGQPILLLHGGAVNFHYNFAMCGWTKILTMYGGKVIGLDFRGHGKSTKLFDTSAYGTNNLANDVIALLGHLNIDRISLVGYSLGSLIALHLLSAFPSRFLKASIVATGDGLVGIPPYTFDAVIPHLVEALSRSEYPEDLPTHIAAYWKFVIESGGDRQAVLAFAKADYPSMTIEAVSTIQTPVLVISGELDPILGQAPMLAKSLPRGRYIEIPGANHFDLAIDTKVQETVAEYLLSTKQIE